MLSFILAFFLRVRVRVRVRVQSPWLQSIILIITISDASRSLVLQLAQHVYKHSSGEFAQLIRLTNGAEALLPKAEALLPRAEGPSLQSDR